MSRATGLNLPRVNFSRIADYQFALPPFGEQQEIVRRLRVLDANLNKARIVLDDIPKLLSEARQSVLRAGLRGELTTEERDGRQSVDNSLLSGESLFSVSKIATDNNVIPGIAALSVGDPKTSLPQSWARIPLSRVAKLESGHTPSRQHPEYWGGDTCWVSIPDAKENDGKIIVGTKSTITDLGLENSAARILPKGTVCVSRTASIGYVTILGKPMATSQDFANWICSEHILPEFLMYAFLAEGQNLVRFGKGTTHSTIYFTELESFYIALPPIKEQKNIVERLKKSLDRLENITEVYSAIAAELQDIEKLILRSALQGELGRWESKEAAASIIENIKRKRAGQSSEKRKTKKKHSMKKLTAQVVVEAVTKIDTDEFGFSDLRKILPGSYDDVRTVVFEMMAKPDSPFSQVFNVGLRTMRFTKTKS